MHYDTLVSEQNSNLLSFIAATVETMRDQMATKADIAALKEQMATKVDIAALKEQMATKVETAAIRGDIEQVQLRLDSIDRALSGRMGAVESEVSRLRSVIYLLVKDKPDMLRLLGQSGLHENRPQS